MLVLWIIDIPNHRVMSLKSTTLLVCHRLLREKSKNLTHPIKLSRLKWKTWWLDDIESNDESISSYSFDDSLRESEITAAVMMHWTYYTSDDADGEWKFMRYFNFSSCLIRRFWSTVCAEKKKSGIFSIHKMISQSKLTSKPSDFAQTPPSSPAIQALETHCDAINWLST